LSKKGLVFGLKSEIFSKRHDAVAPDILLRSQKSDVNLRFAGKSIKMKIALLVRYYAEKFGQSLEIRQKTGKKGAKVKRLFY
jgi:hypothetical protein